MDLWRKMPLADGGAVAAFLHPREGLHPGPYVFLLPLLRLL